MSWGKPKTLLPYEAAANIEAFRFVKFDASDTTVVKAAAATDKIIGIKNGQDQTDSGKTGSITTDGVEELKLGGTVARGDFLTSDANGQGVAAAPAAGVNNRIGAIALASGVSGDVIPAMLKQGSLQGA